MEDEEWRQKLSEEEYRILREAGTEPAGSGKLLGVEEDGTYMCAACGQELFSSETKFDDETSDWPSFYVSLDNADVEFRTDRSHGMERVEVRCGNCGSHLGHVFYDGPEPTGKRYCINSLALDFESED